MYQVSERKVRTIGKFFSRIVIFCAALRIDKCNKIVTISVQFTVYIS